MTEGQAINAAWADNPRREIDRTLEYAQDMRGTAIITAFYSDGTQKQRTISIEEQHAKYNGWDFRDVPMDEER